MRRKTQFWISLVLLGIILSALLGIATLEGKAAATIRQEPPTPTPFLTRAPDKVLDAIALDYPRVDGSTSTYPLQMIIACKIYNVACSWTYGALAPTPTVVVKPVSNALPAINHNGTHPAYMNLIQGKTDLILVARVPSQDERDAAQAQGVALDVQPVALDAFVFLLNPDMPLDNLTLDNIRDIYTGKITDWSQLGVTKEGVDLTIRAYQRERNSGSQELMESLVMKGTPMIEARDLMITSMAGLIEAVAYDPWAIGYSVFYYVKYMNPRPYWEEYLKMIGIEGVQPTRDTIQTGTYPLTSQVYMVTRTDLPQDSTAMMLRDWLLSPGGQDVVASSGYVSLP